MFRSYDELKIGLTFIFQNLSTYEIAPDPPELKSTILHCLLELNKQSFRGVNVDFSA